MRRVVSLHFLIGFFFTTAIAFSQSDYKVVPVTNGGTISGTVKWSGPATRALGFRRHLDQRNCRYIPHILLVPEKAALDMKSSDPTLHTIHMDGAATFNLPFPFPDRVNSRTMPSAGLVHLRCNGGHVWMNAEMMVVSHPYYAVTDESGHFEFTGVPAGTYQIVAWHEGWGLAGKEQAYDVLTERSVQRPLFTEARTWEKSVTVSGNQVSPVNFVIPNGK